MRVKNGSLGLYLEGISLEQWSREYQRDNQYDMTNNAVEGFNSGRKEVVNSLFAQIRTRPVLKLVL